MGDLGAYVDTQGSTKRRKRQKKLSEASDDASPDSEVLPLQEDHDEVEARLESLVFGKHPFQPPLSDSRSHDTSSSDSEEVS